MIGFTTEFHKLFRWAEQEKTLSFILGPEVSDMANR